VSGRVRTITNEHGEILKEAGPSTPVQIVGLSGVPDSGDDFVVVKNEREAKRIAEHRENELKRQAVAQASGPSMEDVFGTLGAEEVWELRMVLKADVRGTMEAIRESAEKVATDRVKLNVLRAGVGAITESDVMLAAASDASIYGFHVRPEPAARKLAEREGVEIRVFDIVYELLDDVTARMAGLLPPKVLESVLGHAEIRELFQIPKRGKIAGCFVADGTINRTEQMRIVRDGVPIYMGAIESLRHFKDDVREVRSGTECGIRIANYDDYKVGDILECVHLEETPDTL
jgi:translation initiation factor IF-2